MSCFPRKDYVHCTIYMDARTLAWPGRRLQQQRGQSASRYGAGGCQMDGGRSLTQNNLKIGFKLLW